MIHPYFLPSATTNIQKAPRPQVSKGKKWMEGLSSWQPAGLQHERPLVLAPFTASWLCYTLLESVALKPAPLCYGSVGNWVNSTSRDTWVPSAWAPVHVTSFLIVLTELGFALKFVNISQVVNKDNDGQPEQIQVCSFFLQVSDLSFLAE